MSTIKELYLPVFVFDYNLSDESSDELLAEFVFDSLDKAVDYSLKMVAEYRDDPEFKNYRVSHYINTVILR